MSYKSPTVHGGCNSSDYTDLSVRSHSSSDTVYILAIHVIIVGGFIPRLVSSY